MAIGLTNRGSGNHNTSALSFTLSPASNLAAGSWAVLCVAADNSGASGTNNNFTTVTDSIGNTWTLRRSPVFDNGAASAGIQGAIYTTNQSVGALQTGTVITVNFTDATVAKTWTLTEVTAGAGETVEYVTGGDKAAGATGTVLTTGATGTINIGEAVLAAFFIEAGTTQTLNAADTDTTNGSWTTNQYNEIGSTTSGAVIVSQGKVQTTAASTQTYDVTLGLSSDYHGSWVVLKVATPQLVTPTTASLVTTRFAPTVSFTSNQLVTPSVATLTLTRFVPTVTASDHKTYTPSTASLTLSSFAPTVTANTGTLATPSTASLSLTPFAPSVTTTAHQTVTPSTATLTLTRFAPTVIANASVLATPTTASLTITRYAPSVSVASVPLSLLVNGIDVMDYVTHQSITVKNTAYSQTGVLGFELNGAPGAFSIAVENTVVLSDAIKTYYNGKVRQLQRRNAPTPGHIFVTVDCQDVSTLPGDDICDVGALRDFVFESDAQRIAWLFTTFGTKGITVGAEVQTLRATMPFQDFTGKSLAEAMDMVAALSGASWYVDYDLKLHYFLVETEVSPYSFSDTPNGVTSVGYTDLTIPDESTSLKNAVYVIGEGIAEWYTDAASVTLYGRREASIRDERVTDLATLDSYGAAFLAEHAYPRRSGSLRTFTTGFRAGQKTYITNADYGLVADEYRVTTVVTSFPMHDEPVYVIEFGDPKQTLAGAIRGTASQVVSAAVATVADTEAPSVPQGVTAIAGFRGAAVKWNPVGGSDLMFYQVRWGTDGITFSSGNMNVKASTVWIPDLEPDTSYFFQVRAVDTSGNVATSVLDATAVSYIVNGEAGWTNAVSATPTQVGSADIAANTITSVMVSTSGLSADVIRAGTLTVAPSVADITGSLAIEVRDSFGLLLGTWEPTAGITIYGTDPSDYAVFDDAYLRFYHNDILVAEIGPDGILADSIRTGVLSGGHNLVLNSSFELAGFVSVSNNVVFTDNTSTTAWKVANRTTAPDNVTEGTSLSATTLAY